MIRSAYILLALFAAATAQAAPNAKFIARRKLVEPTYDAKTLGGKLGVVRGQWTSHFTSGASVERPGVTRESVSPHYQEALSRLVDLDPNKQLLSKDDWAHVEHAYTFGDRQQVRNRDENLEFSIQDPTLKLQQTRRLVEKARGKLAAVLVQALRKKKPDPETLALVTESLAKKFPFFENPFRVEGFIADMRGMAPQLARWDFGHASRDDGAPMSKLPPKIQRVVRDLGQRVFANANVLFTDHLYEDGVVMIDAMRAAGLDTANARFVTTPYPFDDGVRQKIEARGVKTAHAPYDKIATKAHVEQAIGELVERSKQNHGPILVMDDGGMAAEVIAEKFPHELHRFRVVEITKAGERVAKGALPKTLQIDREALRMLDSKQLANVKARYLVANSSDNATRAEAEKRWGEVERWLRIPSMSSRREPQGKLSGEVYGFAHYTYSDSKYKREVMTPLYTQAVNRATFEAIEGAGKQLNNKRVTIIGGGAMGVNAGLELREKGFEVTFVDPDAARKKLLEEEHHFATSELKPALKGRGLVLELSGMHKLITADHLFLMDDGTHVVHGSSKDNPFDMKTIEALATEVTPWSKSPTGQASASYTFEVSGRKRTLHFPGNGFTISHGGKAQNVPLKKFLPEVEHLLRLGAHAITTQTPATQYPFFGTPDWLAQPGKQKAAIRDASFSLEQQPAP